MMDKVKRQTIGLSEGRSITIETGYLAKQAHGTVVVRMGKALLLATVVEREERQRGSFLPLTVDYQEKFAGAGRIPGGFFKRERALNEHEIIVSRLIDRNLRPLFPKDYFHSLQVTVFLLSSDEGVSTEGLAVLAASSALAISPIPFGGPVASVTVGRKDGVFYVNPSPSEILASDFCVTVAGTEERVIMLEGSAQEVSEEELLQVIKFAQEAIRKQCKAQNDLVELVGGVTEEVGFFGKTEEEEAFEKAFCDLLRPLLYEIVQRGLKGKQERVKAFAAAKECAMKRMEETGFELTGKEHIVSEAVAMLKREVIRAFVLENKLRIDGRRPDEIRPIHVAVDYLPNAHGSAVFTRGDTQVLATLTLGSSSDVQYLDGVSAKGEKQFIANYNFPAFSTGEVRPNRGPGRREIGHGNLVWHAIKPQLPDSPYTFRLTVDALSSDGSSSMASVCGASLAFMDAGIKIEKQVAGIAMGLVHEQKCDEVVILSDILSDEDACGDADFKIAGTKDGITACQMDIKTAGISCEILEQILLRAKEGRLHILGIMNKVLHAPREGLKSHAPVIVTLSIKPEMIGTVIGPRGKMIQKLQQDTEADISITDEGLVVIFGPNQKAAEMAFEAVQTLVAEPEIEHVYKKAVIKSFVPYGAFIEFLPGKEGLLHVKEMSDEYVEHPSKLFKIGQEIEVRLISITKSKERNGQIKFGLSVKKV